MSRLDTIKSPAPRMDVPVSRIGDGLPGETPKFQPSGQEGNWVERIGEFARSIQPLLVGAGSVIESIRGVPYNQRRFAGPAMAMQANMMARSMGFENARELMEARMRGSMRPGETKPPITEDPGKSVLPEPEIAPLGGDLTRYIGEEGDPNKKIFGLSAVQKIAEESGLSPQDVISYLRTRGSSDFQFGPRVQNLETQRLQEQGFSGEGGPQMQLQGFGETDPRTSNFVDDGQGNYFAAGRVGTGAKDFDPNFNPIGMPVGY